jgi:hypothetical protein
MASAYPHAGKVRRGDTPPLTSNSDAMLLANVAGMMILEWSGFGPDYPTEPGSGSTFALIAVVTRFGPVQVIDQHVRQQVDPKAGKDRRKQV